MTCSSSNTSASSFSIKVGRTCSTKILWNVVFALSSAKLFAKARSSERECDLRFEVTCGRCSDVESFPNFALVHIEFAIFVKDVFGAFHHPINDV